jgi:phosphoribosylcarboxyaminoimidazole (NCAIR) mutase
MSGSRRRFRLAAVLATGIAIGVAMTATPVSGHVSTSVTHLWNAHIKPKTDARYYTKAQANGRYLRTAGTAANAQLLDGLDSTAFLPVAGTAANAEQLDGLDSAAFVQGNGQAAGGAVAIAPNTVGVPLLVPDVLSLTYVCPANLADNGALFFTNSTDGTVNVFVESGGANPTTSVLPGNQTTSLPLALPTGDSFHIQFHGAFGVATIDVATVHRADCLVQAQAVVTRS